MDIQDLKQIYMYAKEKADNPKLFTPSEVQWSKLVIQLVRQSLIPYLTDILDEAVDNTLEAWDSETL
ncbi:MAG: hypothetical protein NVS1B10_08990 [Candidatus Saccharimonadales bacterium]